MQLANDLRNVDSKSSQRLTCAPLLALSVHWPLADAARICSNECTNPHLQTRSSDARGAGETCGARRCGRARAPGTRSSRPRSTSAATTSPMFTTGMTRGNTGIRYSRIQIDTVRVYSCNAQVRTSIMDGCLSPLWMATSARMRSIRPRWIIFRLSICKQS